MQLSLCQQVIFGTPSKSIKRNKKKQLESCFLKPVEKDGVTWKQTLGRRPQKFVFFQIQYELSEGIPKSAN